MGRQMLSWLGFYIPALTIIILNGAISLGCTSTTLSLSNLYIAKINQISVGVLGICDAKTCAFALSPALSPAAQKAANVPIWGIWPFQLLALFFQLLNTISVPLFAKRPDMHALRSCVKYTFFLAAFTSLIGTLSVAQQGALLVNGETWIGAAPGAVSRGLMVIALGSVATVLSFGLAVCWMREWVAFNCESSLVGKMGGGRE
ncbi:hypothetical protein P280DRAFT_553859 [Massarina eburnea CBS 473.64]|uniref:Uncharacterized protein n=1 Tax=Massarina eburnea CBS 473.64 TaxID=1395130 RepID=A0A6A6RMH4_9PLEO|nr:hypothetical protein P280DRAFT_553859 [Massarina eburnea CBS 473.64]